jgi:hypothetical protein
MSHRAILRAQPLLFNTPAITVGEDGWLIPAQTA